MARLTVPALDLLPGDIVTASRVTIVRRLDAGELRRCNATGHAGYLVRYPDGGTEPHGWYVSATVDVERAEGAR